MTGSDHPSYDTSSTPARQDLSPAQQASAALGEALILENASGRLKVFDDCDNQLETEDLDRFQTSCYNCGGKGEYIIAQSRVPHFGYVNLMSFSCEECGYTTRKVNSNMSSNTDSSGSVKSGKRMTLLVSAETDLQRQVVRAESCSLVIPEIEFESEFCDGILTTVEGLLQSISAQFATSIMFSSPNHETTTEQFSNKVSSLFQNLIDEVVTGTGKFTIVLDDPENNSYIQGFGEDDTQLQTEVYDSVAEQQKQTEAEFVETQQRIASGEFTNIVDLAKISIGDSFSCQYQDDWIADCVVVRKVLNKNPPFKPDFFWVCERKNFCDEEVSKSTECWMVTVEQMRTKDGFWLQQAEVHKESKLPEDGTYSTADLLEVLNSMAEHVEIEESSQIRNDSKLSIDKESMKNFESLD